MITIAAMRRPTALAAAMMERRAVGVATKRRIVDIARVVSGVGETWRIAEIVQRIITLLTSAIVVALKWKERLVESAVSRTVATMPIM